MIHFKTTAVFSGRFSVGRLNDMKLREYRPETDFKSVASWVGDERTHALWCADRMPYPLTQDAFHAALAQDEHEWGGKAYVLEDENNVLSGVLVYAANSTEKGFLKFILVDPEKRGQGLGKRMIQLLLRDVFAQADTIGVHLNVFDVNTPAIRCYEQVGFTQESLQPEAFSFEEEKWGRCHMVIRKSHLLYG